MHDRNGLVVEKLLSDKCTSRKIRGHEETAFSSAVMASRRQFASEIDSHRRRPSLSSSSSSLLLILFFDVIPCLVREP